MERQPPSPRTQRALRFLRSRLLVVPFAVLMAAAGLLLMRSSFRDAALVTRSPAMQGD